MTDTPADTWHPTVGAITLVVDDLAASRAFYTSVFAAPIVFETEDSTVFGFGTMLVNLLLRSSAGELLDPTPIGTRDDGARIVFTVPVPDTDAYCARLAALRVPLINGPVTRPWGPRTASFADPDGHVWEIAT
jgi:catechol 2,3-dioxygenase-like lactoylglutathione lyase family enzyme